MGRESKRRLGLFLIVAGLLLVAAGIALGSYNLWDNRRAGSEVEPILEAIVQHRKDLPAERQSSPTETMPADQPEPEAPAQEISTPEMPVVEIDGYRYIGTVTIPVLDLELPVMEDWSYPQLKIAPCRYAGSVYQGNMILCAHNYATHFGRLKNLLAGDDVVFIDADGNEFFYAVAQVETLAPTAIEEMESGGWDLTLFTCTLGGRTRVTVRCRLLENDKLE